MKTTIKPIKTEDDYQAALEQISTLMDAKSGTIEADELEVLATLVECYEDEHYPIWMPDPIDAIRFRMEQAGLNQRDLIPYIGSRSKVSEVLSGKRPLTLQMIRSLSQNLGIPAEVLLQEPGAKIPNNLTTTDWKKYPIAAIKKLGWVADHLGTDAEQIVRELIDRAGGDRAEAMMLCRKNGNIGDRYALQIWGLKLMAIARENLLSIPYRPGSITIEMAQKLVHLSCFEHGPKLAQEFLAHYGIHLIYLPHLPKTYLDGAALRLVDGTPVIGLTLRYDRIDNFWFSLCHELAHQALHLDQNLEESFFEDLSSEAPQNNVTEQQANDWASEVLIPECSTAEVLQARTSQEVIKLAKQWEIHPAIIAGRIRKETGNYRLLNNHVGNGEVRKLFIDT